jgi:hypothetical protein
MTEMENFTVKIPIFNLNIVFSLDRLCAGVFSYQQKPPAIQREITDALKHGFLPLRHLYLIGSGTGFTKPI